MIKGVHNAPTQASLSLKKASVTPVGSLVENKEKSLQATNSHITVLLDEAVEALAVKPDGVYVDGTFGRGGHSKKILAQLGSSGRLVAFDRDLSAIESGKAIQDSRFTMVHSHFSAMQAKLTELGISKVDGILLDLGISSPQIDEASRGFSFRFDAPLDMRMDQSRGQTVADYLAATTEQHLGAVSYTHLDVYKRQL